MRSVRSVAHPLAERLTDEVRVRTESLLPTMDASQVEAVLDVVSYRALDQPGVTLVPLRRLQAAAHVAAPLGPTAAEALATDDVEDLASAVEACGDLVLTDQVESAVARLHSIARTARPSPAAVSSLALGAACARVLNVDAVGRVAGWAAGFPASRLDSADVAKLRTFELAVEALAAPTVVAAWRTAFPSVRDLQATWPRVPTLESAVLLGNLREALEMGGEYFHPKGEERGWVIAKTPYNVDLALPKRKLIFQVMRPGDAVEEKLRPRAQLFEEVLRELGWRVVWLGPEWAATPPGEAFRQRVAAAIQRLADA